MITINQNMETEQNYVTWILTALLFILKLKIFTKISLMMLKDGLTHLIIMRMTIGKKKKVIVLFTDELGGRIMKKIIYSYLTDDESEKKKLKEQKTLKTLQIFCLTIKSY